MRGQGHKAQWFQALVLFTQKEMRIWRDMKNNTSSVPSNSGSATSGACVDADDTVGSARLLFLKPLDEAMDVSFQHTIKQTLGVIALYGLKKHVSVYSNHCVCLVGFALVHENEILQWIVQKRSLPMRSLHMSMGFISHKDIIMAQKVGMNPHLKAHICVSTMHGHVLDKTVSNGVYLSERTFCIHLRKWTVQARSALHLWIMLRYTLAGFGGTEVPLLPAMCLEQVSMSGIPLEGDNIPDTSCINNIVRVLLAVECIPSSEQYFQTFVRYIQQEYVPSLKRLQEIEKAFSQRDCEWERFPVIH